MRRQESNGRRKGKKKSDVPKLLTKRKGTQENAGAIQALRSAKKQSKKNLKERNSRRKS